MSREIASTDIATTTNPEPLYFIGQDAVGNPVQKILGSNVNGRLPQIAVANPEGLITASEGVFVRAIDGTVWHKFNGGDTSSGWREMVQKDENGNIVAAIELTEDPDPSLVPGELGLVDGQLSIGVAGSRKGRRQDGWVTEAFTVENGADPAAAERVLTNNTLTLTPAFLTAFFTAYGATPFGDLKLLLDFQWYDNFTAAATTSPEISAHFTDGDLALPTTTTLPANQLVGDVDGFNEGTLTLNILAPSAGNEDVEIQQDLSFNHVVTDAVPTGVINRPGAASVTPGGSFVGDPLLVGMKIAPAIKLPTETVGRLTHLSIRTRWRVIEAPLVTYTP